MTIHCTKMWCFVTKYNYEFCATLNFWYNKGNKKFIILYSVFRKTLNKRVLILCRAHWVSNGQATATCIWCTFYRKLTEQQLKSYTAQKSSSKLKIKHRMSRMPATCSKCKFESDRSHGNLVLCNILNTSSFPCKAAVRQNTIFTLMTLSFYVYQIVAGIFWRVCTAGNLTCGVEFLTIPQFHVMTISL